MTFKPQCPSLALAPSKALWRGQRNVFTQSYSQLNFKNKLLTIIGKDHKLFALKLPLSNSPSCWRNWEAMGFFVILGKGKLRWRNLQLVFGGLYIQREIIVISCVVVGFELFQCKNGFQEYFYCHQANSHASCHKHVGWKMFMMHQCPRALDYRKK